MSNALIDALLPASKTPRTADPAAPRASERGQGFAPVLNKALDARPAAGAERSADDDSNADDPAIGPASRKAARSNDAVSRQESGVDETAETDERADQSAGDADEGAEDVVEISAEAAAAAVVAALVTAEEQNANLSVAVDGVVEVPAAENSAGDADAENTPTKPATAAADSNVEATADVAAASTLETEASVDFPGDDDAGAELTRLAAPKNAKAGDESAQPSASPAAATSAASNTAGQAAENAPHSATGRKATEASNDDLADEDQAKSSPASDRSAASNEQASAPDASAELDAAIESLHRGEGTAGDALDSAPSDANNAAATPIGPQAPEAGRSPAHPTALSRLAAERSLNLPAESAGDDGGIDRGRFVGRVEGAIRAAQQRDGRVQVRLSPPELGALRIELTIQQGALAARLEAETPAARNLLLDNLPVLRDRLAQQDIRIERFDVDLRQDASSGGGSQQETMQERQPREAERRQNPVRSDRGRSGAAPSSATPREASPSAASDLGLDVRV